MPFPMSQPFVPSTAAAPPLRVQMRSDGSLAFDKDALRARLSLLAPDAPVVAMVHGYRFAPDQGQHCPFGHIFALAPQHPADRTAVSWPRHLGLGGAGGLAIGFGWHARGLLPRVDARALEAGRALASLAAELRALAPQRRLDVIAHSLGARVALAALNHANSGDFRRLILLAAAETRRPARAAMHSPAGQAAQVINVTTRENDIFDMLYEWGAKAGLDTAIGQGLGRGHEMRRWLNVQLDQPQTLAALARHGHPIPSRPARICHWSPYIRPGIFSAYRALLDGSLPPEMLAASLPPAQSPRWSALVPRLGRAAAAAPTTP